MASRSKWKKLKNSYFVASLLKASANKFTGKKIAGMKRREFYTPGNRRTLKKDTLARKNEFFREREEE